jgi:hypothetical protein
VAQCCTIAVCRAAGLAERKQLAPDLPVPKDNKEVFAVATDDIILFSSSRASATRRTRRLDESFASLGVERHPAKDVDGVLEGRCLGIDFHNGTSLSPAADSLFHLLCSCIHIASSGPDFAISPRASAGLLGVARWFCLLRRSMLSIFSAVYVFSRIQPDKVPCAVSAEVKQELLLFACLAGFLDADLTRPWHGTLCASDASQDFGFGLCSAELGAGRMRALAQHSSG